MPTDAAVAEDDESVIRVVASLWGTSRGEAAEHACHADSIGPSSAP